MYEYEEAGEKDNIFRVKENTIQQKENTIQEKEKIIREKEKALQSSEIQFKGIIFLEYHSRKREDYSRKGECTKEFRKSIYEDNSRKG